jgi:hypothetical protein
LFRLKITSSRRGALARTRCSHLNCNDKKADESVGAEGLREDRHHNKEHRTNEMYWEGSDSQFSQSPRGGASEASAPVATSRSTSQSPAPRGARPQAATTGTEQSWSLSKGPGWPSSRRDGAAASGAAQLLGHGTARGLSTR